MPRGPTSRRRLLASCTATLGAAIAGCTDGSGGDESPANGSPDGDGMGSTPDGDSDESGADNGDDTAHITVGPDGRPGFDPEQVELQPGATVQWEWASDDHTVTPQSVPGDVDWEGEPEAHDEGHTYQHTFDQVGVYQYACDTHTGSNTGTLHIRQQPDPTGE